MKKKKNLLSKNLKGSMSQSKDGRWKVRLTNRAVDYDKQRMFRNKADAYRYLQELNRELEQILESANPEFVKYTLARYIEEKFLPHKARTVKDTTLSRLKSIANTHVIPRYGNLTLMKIKPVDIQQQIDELKYNGKSYSTVKKVYDFYGNMFSYAVDYGDILSQNNPMNRVVLPPEKSFPKDEAKDKTKYFTVEELKFFTVEALRTNVVGEPIYRWGEVFLFLFNTGLRVGEMSALKKEDVDIEEGLLYVKNSIAVIDNKKTISTTKTARSKRTVPLNDEAKRLAKIIKERFPHGEMFIYTEDGNYTDATQLDKPFKNILRNAGLAKRGIHSTRHTFVSHLFENDVDIETIAELIGDQVATVQRTYLHLNRENLARSINLVNITGQTAQGVC